MSTHVPTAQGVVILDAERGQVGLDTGNGTEIASVPVDRFGADDDVSAWTAAVEALEFGAVSAVVVRATDIGLVCLDARGTSLHAVVWAGDDCSAPDAAWCRKKHDDAWWEAEVGLVPEAGHLVTKLSWLHRSAPEAWLHARILCSLEDHVRHHLVATGTVETARIATVTTRPDVVARFGLWGNGSYSESVLSLIDAEKDWAGVLPAVGVEGAVLGTWRGVEVRL